MRNYLKLKKGVIEKIIERYTSESGVRGLEKQVAKAVRYAAKSIAMEEKYNENPDLDDLNTILGPAKVHPDSYEDNLVAGVVTGLAWTSVGGAILFIESAISKGKGALTITGNLGKIMKESATIALEYIKANATLLDLKQFNFDAYNIHIHVPEGATPKDGPSAGIKEKILAAKRAKIKEIILSEQNRKDVEDINPSYLKGLHFHYVKAMEEVIALAITSQKVKNAKDFEMVPISQLN